jgi:ribonuclease T1
MLRLPALGMVLLVWLVVACAGTSTEAGSGTSTTITRDPVSGLPAVQVDLLPPEVGETLALIQTDGPFPNAQDGAVFRNREGLLPQRPAGHYREYTVETPGSDDRGARRIVVGADGERYYTDDHYDSFRWIAP